MKKHAANMVNDVQHPNPQKQPDRAHVVNTPATRFTPDELAVVRLLADIRVAIRIGEQADPGGRAHNE